MSSATPVLRSNLTLPQDRIAALCEKYQVEELSLFGSVLRDDFGPESDVDLLVAFKNGDAGPWMAKVFALEKDLAALLGRKVDVATKEGVEQSKNRITRPAILDSAQVIYRVPGGASGALDGGGPTGSQQAPPALSAIPPLVLARIRYDPEHVAEFCRRNHIARLALFGSVLRDDFSPESDVDVLVQFEPGHTPAWEFFGMQDKLTTLFRRRVDLSTPGFLSRYFRDQVQAEAVTLYESRTRIDRHGSTTAHA
jgi:predicted nucleotidyltransferase